MRAFAIGLSVICILTAGRAMAGDQRILPPDLDRISKQRAVIEKVVRDRYGIELPGGDGDLAILQRLVDDEVFHRGQKYELQSLGIVLGQALAAQPDLSWVTVQDEYGTDPALRYKNTTILIFPLTMISKRVEDGRHVEVEALYQAALRRVRELESEADRGRRPAR